MLASRRLLVVGAVAALGACARVGFAEAPSGGGDPPAGDVDGGDASLVDGTACDDLDPCTNDDLYRDGLCAGVPFNKDDDLDGAFDAACAGGADCDDSSPFIGPVAAEGPALDPTCNDDVDNDCDGLTDAADPDCIAGGATSIFRSVGPDSVGALKNGWGTIEIRDNVVAFANAMPNRIGVGDALTYDTDGDGTRDAIAFIHRRSSAYVYQVRSAGGAAPTPASPTSSWALWRAYTSLFDAERGSENSGIDASLADFDPWTGGKDIADSNEVWNIACYADAIDQTAVILSGWLTSPTSYIKIFTPSRDDEVGDSQRHPGRWDSSKYQLIAANTDTLFVDVDHLWVDGLQLELTSISADNQKTLELQASGVAEFRVSNNLLKGDATADTNWHSGMVIWSGGSGTAWVWNNVAFDFGPGCSGDCVGFEFYDDFEFYAYNNTAHNCGVGFGTWGSSPPLVINALSYANTRNYVGTFAAGSANNLSGPTLSDAPGADPINATTVSFVNVAAGDFHLAGVDAGATAAGLNLSDDAFLSFDDDIDGDPRPAPPAAWDVGADQH